MAMPPRLCLKRPSGESVVLPAKAILVAAGKQPNTVLGPRKPGKLKLDGRLLRNRRRERDTP